MGDRGNSGILGVAVTVMPRVPLMARPPTQATLSPHCAIPLWGDDLAVRARHGGTLAGKALQPPSTGVESALKSGTRRPGSVHRGKIGQKSAGGARAVCRTVVPAVAETGSPAIELLTLKGITDFYCLHRWALEAARHRVCNTKTRLLTTMSSPAWPPAPLASIIRCSTGGVS